MEFLSEYISRFFSVRTFNKTREKFYEDLADAITDRETLTKFISIRKTRSIKQNDPLAALYASWINRLSKKGGRLSYMLQGTAPESDLMILAAIEGKGELPVGLRFLAKTIKDRRGMKASMQAAIAMPAVVTLIMLIFMGILSVFVIPVFAELAPVDKWITIGKILYAISYVIVHWGLLLLVLGGGLLALFFWSLNNWTGKQRAVVDRYLPYRVYRDYTGAIFLVALAGMLKAGDSLNRALEQLKKRNSPWLRWHIDQILKNMDKSSENYGEAFSTGVFSQELSNRLVDYSRRSGEFESVVSRIGVEGIGQIRTEVDESAKKLNLFLVVVLGGILAFMLVGVVLTAQGLSSSLREEVSMQRGLK